MQLLDEQLATVTRPAKDNELPDAILTESGLKITPLDAAVPDRAQALIDQTSQLLPRIKITGLLMDVDDWTGFSRHFTHLKDGAEAKDRTLLLSAILGDAINLGLDQDGRVEPRPDLRQAVLAASAAHPRRNLFGGLGRAGQPPVSPRLCRPLGRRHDLILRWPALPRAGGRGESTGHVNPKYGSEPGRLFYTHISDQYAPFSTRVVNCRRRAIPPMCSTACCTTSPTCGSRSTTPTRPASPITSLP
ncbi:Tn3 family transposase [Klebsiella pneumoniae subsp. pneumoniae]|nr:Tn3 family transposase [Klebsiella pneumoniae subsp. pneumoniae]